MAVTLTVYLDDETPPRAWVYVAGLTGGEDVVIWRETADTERATIRGGEVSSAPTSVALLDAEAPCGVTVTWGVEVDGVDVATDTDTINLPAVDSVAVTDATTGLTAVARLSSLTPEESAESTVFQVGGRNVVVSGDWNQWVGPAVFRTTTEAEKDALAAVFRGALGRIVQIRQAGTVPDVDCYAAVLRARPNRLTGAPGDHRRVWSVDLAQTDAWPSTVDTYRDVQNLASDPAATANGAVAGELVWDDMFYGSGGGAGATTLLTGQVDGPVAWVTTYMRKTWSAAPSGNGQTGFYHTTGYDTPDAGYPVQPGDVYTISSYVRTNASDKSAQLDVYWHTASGTQTLSAGTPVALTANTWTRLSRTVTVPAGMYSMTPTSNIAASGTAWANGNRLDGTALMVEAGSTLHAYGDGDAPGWEWLGTADASPSHGWDIPL